MNENILKKLIRLLRKGFFRVMYYFGVGHFLLWRNKRKGRAPILLFHRVSDSPDPFWPPLSVENFKKTIVFFSKYYVFRSIHDLFTLRENDLKESCFVVFDDAYQDFIDNALPVLDRYNVPVTMFVAVDSIVDQRPIWTTWLNNCIWITKRKVLVIHKESGQKSMDISTLGNKLKAAKRFEKWLKSLPYNQFKIELNRILSDLDVHEPLKEIGVINWNTLSSTSDRVIYQSHTMSHPLLAKIESEEVLEYEMKESRSNLARHIRNEVKYISYPIGSYSQKVIKKASEVYDAGFAVDNKPVDLKRLKEKNYRYMIPRFNVSDSDPYELFFRVNGFHKLVKG